MKKNAGKATELTKIASLSALVLVISLGAWCERSGIFFSYAFVFPILTAVFFYGRRGGLLVSLFASLLTGAQINWAQYPEALGATKHFVFLIIIFNLIALVSSELAERERAQRQAAQRQADELALLYEINRELSHQALDLERVLGLVVERAAQFAQADSVIILFYDQNKQNLTVQLGYGKTQIDGLQLTLSEYSPALEALNTLKPVSIPDASQRRCDLGEQFGFKAYLAAPIVLGKRAIGLIALGDTRSTRPFLESQVRLVTGLAAQAAIAIKNAQLFATAQRRASELLAMIETDRDISATLDLPSVLEKIASHAKEIVGADQSSIYLLGPLFSSQADTLVSVITIGQDKSTASTPIKLGQGDIGSIAQFGQAKIIHHAQNAPIELAQSQSLLCAPLIARGQIIGVMALGRFASNLAKAFVQADLNFLVSLAQQAAIAIQNAWNYEGARARAIEQATLNEITRIALSTHDLQAMLQSLAIRVGHLMGADAVFITRWDQTRSSIQLLMTCGQCPQECPDLLIEPPSPTLTGTLLETRRSLMITDVHDSPHIPSALAAQLDISALLGLPLLTGARPLGALLLGYKQSRRLESGEIRLARAAAEQITLAIEKASLYNNAQRRTQELKALHQTMLDVAAQLEMQRLLATITQRTTTLLSIDGSAIYLIKADTQSLQLAAVHNIPERWVDTRLALGEGMAGRVAQTGKAMTIDDYSTWDGRADVYDSDLFGSVLAVPIKWAKRITGVISCFTKAGKQHNFGDTDIRLLQSFAQQVAVAVQNARVFQLEQHRSHELAQALAGQQELDRLKDQFIQNVSHELRTPMALILGYAEMLNSGAVGEMTASQQEPIAIIARRALALCVSVENITTMLEVEEHKREPTPVDFARIVLQVLGDFQKLADQKQITLQSEVQPDVPFVMAESSHLRRVIDNLMSNALKFTPDKGNISVRLSPADEGVCLQVSDTGVGIPADKYEKIFERFYQIDGSASRRHGGTGIGLAVVKEIVKNYTGRVSVQSQLDKGSTFSVWLPAASTTEQLD